MYSVNSLGLSVKHIDRVREAEASNNGIALA